LSFFKAFWAETVEVQLKDTGTQGGLSLGTCVPRIHSWDLYPIRQKSVFTGLFH
jgi:hypothetical protein